MSNLTATLVQTQLAWEDPARNCAHLQALSDAGPTDLIVLPEMFATGFSMRSQAIAEAADGPSASWLKQLAQQHNCAATGSLAIAQATGVANRMFFATPDETHHYDKRHLFRMGGEHNRYLAGRERKIVNWRGWRILLQVCYDLRFPVFSRNNNDYDLAIYVANWPAARRYAWRQLLIARAIENQCFVIGVNRVGADGNGLDYAGDSLVLDPLGQPIIDMLDHNGAQQTSLNLEQLLDLRENFPVHLDADPFTLL